MAALLQDGYMRGQAKARCNIPFVAHLRRCNPRILWPATAAKQKRWGGLRIRDSRETYSSEMLQLVESTTVQVALPPN